MSADGSHQTRVSTGVGADSSPVWSSDGYHIGFVSNRDGNFEIYQVAVDVSAEIRLTNDQAFEGGLDWAP
jgi:Tol biopolymer transport system component